MDAYARAVLPRRHWFPLAGFLLSCGSGGAPPEPGASASTGVPAVPSSDPVIPEGCDYLVVPGKHIIARDPAVAPFKSTEGRTIEGSYCFRGVKLWNPEGLVQEGCTHQGNAGTDSYRCPGVIIQYAGPMVALSRITIVPAP